MQETQNTFRSIQTHPQKHTTMILRNIWDHNYHCIGPSTKSIQFTSLAQWPKANSDRSLELSDLQTSFPKILSQALALCNLECLSLQLSALRDVPAAALSSHSLQAFPLFAPTDSCSNSLFPDNGAKSLCGLWFLSAAFDVYFSLRITPWIILFIEAAWASWWRWEFRGFTSKFTRLTLTFIVFGAASLRDEGQHEKTMLNTAFNETLDNAFFQTNISWAVWTLTVEIF